MSRRAVRLKEHRARARSRVDAPTSFRSGLRQAALEAAIKPWVIIKFGGSSVAHPEGWRRVAQRVRELIAGGERPLVVASALRGVSDDLEALPDAAMDGAAGEIIARVRRRHDELLSAIDLPMPDAAAALLDRIEQVATGIALIGAAPAGTRAELLGLGELISTRIGAAALAAEGLELPWLDARELLRVPDRVDENRHFLSNRWEGEPVRIDAAGGAITQGFIAGDSSGRTVLFGRGGSDVSAAFFAAGLGASRCELWSDVPGLFSADPRIVPTARLLRRLDYAEAQEIASMGAKVVHPGCIEPLRQAGIPLHTRCTERPEAPGTVIAAGLGGGEGHVKAVCSRRGITVVRMDTIGMWQQAGFLADVFAVFKAMNLSVDMVSTSEANVTLTLDPDHRSGDAAVLAELLDALAPFAQARVITGCASIALVGRRIRSILHELAPSLAVFMDRRVHLLSQAASDLNLSLVVDGDNVDVLTKRLHGALVAGRTMDPEAGETLDESVLGRSAHAGHGRWWRDRRDELSDIARRHGAAYAVSIDAVRHAAQTLKALPLDRVLYAIKANDHPAVLQAAAGEGLGIECVSLAEVEHALAVLPELRPDEILFTPNFAPRHEFEAALNLGVCVTVDALFPLRAWPEIFAGKPIALRLDPGSGRGHHKHVRTGGDRAKFGISVADLDEAIAVVDAAGATVVGLHAHSGSGIREAKNWSELGGFLIENSRRFPGLRFIDLGGGLAVPYRPDDEGLDMSQFAAVVEKLKAAAPNLELWIEPGRFVAALAGVLVSEVTQTKGKGAMQYVGLHTGMNSLLRPALYGAYHEIHNISRLDETPSELVQVVGPICETGDFLGHDRRLPPTAAGDVLLIDGAGAYGAVMASHYNRRPPAPVVILP